MHSAHYARSLHYLCNIVQLVRGKSANQAYDPPLNQSITTFPRSGLNSENSQWLMPGTVFLCMDIHLEQNSELFLFRQAFHVL